MKKKITRPVLSRGETIDSCCSEDLDLVTVLEVCLLFTVFTFKLPPTNPNYFQLFFVGIKYPKYPDKGVHSLHWWLWKVEVGDKLTWNCGRKRQLDNLEINLSRSTNTKSVFLLRWNLSGRCVCYFILQKLSSLAAQSLFIRIKADLNIKPGQSWRGQDIWDKVIPEMFKCYNYFTLDNISTEKPL